MSKCSELSKQLEELDRRIDEAKQNERARARRGAGDHCSLWPFAGRGVRTLLKERGKIETWRESWKSRGARETLELDEIRR
jgi:hypothetical protein